MFRAAPFRSIVVATDFSGTAAHAAERALRLPLTEDARLTVVHVLKASLSPWGAAPREDAGQELERVRAAMERSAPDGVRVAARLAEGSPYAEIVRTARQEQAELVVLGRTGRSPLRDHFLGTTAEQVVRNGDASVLLVRNARVLPYRQPVCAVDVGGTAPEILGLARRVAPEAIEPTTLVHAWAAPYEGVFFPSLTTERRKAYRSQFREQARGELLEHLTAAGFPFGTWRLILSHGAPRACVPAEVARLDADLLAMGTHGHRGPAFALLGSVAGDILRGVGCDTLVARTTDVTFHRP